MSGYNKVILMGNLTKDPEIRYTPNGTAVANFSIAVNRRYKINGEVKDEVSYLDIVVFGKQAENCGQYINKGDSILVDGRLQQRRWESEDGQKRSKIEIVAQSVQFMSKKQGSSQGFAAEDGGISNTAGGLPEEEVPF
jgi:single-strand DNA-binding protein